MIYVVIAISVGRAAEYEVDLRLCKLKKLQYDEIKSMVDG